MRVLGLDSAERTGFALVAREPGGRERLLRHGCLTAITASHVEAAVAELAGEAPDLVAIEAPFVKVNASTGLVLATLLGRWLQEWERRGTRTTTVLASTWQISLLAGLIGRASVREARKAAARSWTKAIYGAELSEDEADAACIAGWALRRGLIGGGR
jgi:Holliday junction resolvasome RuvABC endonuclease subunit